MDVHVLQGERPMAADNAGLSRASVEGIPSSTQRTPVEITFDIDANGILNVTARDKATSREQKVTITASTNLNKDEIERMVQQAREHEAADRAHRELVDARNTADNLAYQTEKTLSELGEKVSEQERQNIQDKVTELREAIKSDDISRIKRLSDDLQNAFHALSQQLYAQGQPAQGPTQPGGNGNQPGSPTPEDEGDVIEGEFRPA